MNCKDANKKISLLIDGMLDEKQKHSLLEHIKVCKDCKKLYDDMRSMVTNLSELPEIQLPDGAENKIHFTLIREAEAPKKTTWIKFAAIAAPATMALVAVVFGISYLFSGGMRSDETNEMAVFEKAEMQEETMAEAKSMAVSGEDGEFGNGTVDSVEEVPEETRMMIAEESAEDAAYDSNTVMVYVDSQSKEELIDIAESIISMLEVDILDELVYDSDSKSAVINLPLSQREIFITQVENSGLKAEFSDDIDQNSDDSENLLFEVIFLFQNND